MEEHNVSLQQLGTAWSSLIKDQAKLFSLESELAHRSLLPLFASWISFVLCMISLWAMTLVLGFYTLYLYTHDILISLLSIFGINVLLVTIALISVLRYKARMQFKHSRAALKELLK
jgi:hypothetical protein